MTRRPARLWALSVCLCLGLAAAGAAAAPGSADTPAAVQMSRGDELLRSGQLDKAVAAYRKAVELAPQDAEAHYKLGIALGRSNRPQAAIAELQVAERLDPRNVQVARTLAAAYEFVNMPDKALTAYERVVALATDPRLIADARKHATLIKAKAAAQHGQTAQALKMLNQLRSEQGDDPQILYYIGVTQMLSNHPDEAAAALKKVIRAMPDNRNAYQDLVRVEEQRGDFAAAVDYMQTLIKLVPPQSKDYPRYALQLATLKARLALQQGKPDKAMTALRQALTLDPKNVFANYSIGVIFQGEGRWVEAEKAYNQVLEVTPGNLDARLRLASVYIDINQVGRAVDQLRLLVQKAGNTPQGKQAKEMLARIQASVAQQRGGPVNLDEEIQRLEQQVVQQPGDVAAHMKLGSLYLRKNDLKKAREQYETAVSLDPSNENAHGTLGSIDENLNDFNEGARQYAIAVSLEPNPDRAQGIARLLLLAVGKAAFSDHDMKTARELFDQVLAVDPHNPVALLYSGLIYSTNSQLEDAATTFQTMLRANPNQLAARINLALVYERLNREDDAIREYRYVIEQSPTSHLGEEAAHRLKLVEKRIKGLFSTLQYQMVYDGNSSLSAHPTNEYRTDLNMNFSFRYKADNNIRYTFTWAPQYTTYHVGHFDFLTNNFTVALSTISARRTLSGGFSHAIQNSLSNGGRVSSSSTLFLESLESFRMPSIVDWNPEAPVDTSARFDFYYSDLNAGSNAFFSAHTLSLGASLDQFIEVRELLGLSYLYTRNRNKEDVGSDNAYDSHRVGINYQRALGNKVSASVGYNFFYYSYINPDSASHFTQRRRNISHLFTASLSYSLARNMSLYLNYFYQQNNSNLPVGFVFSTQDRAQSGLQNGTPGTPIGVQSTSLGDFSRQSLSAGITWNF